MRESIEIELLEIEAILLDDALKEEDRFSLYGAQQALRNILDPETWSTASQTFYRIGSRPNESGTARRQ